MRLTTLALIAIAAVICPALAGPAGAKEGKSDRIVVRYVPPKDEKLRPIYEYVKDARALEEMQPLLRPLKLPRTLVIEAKDCAGDSNAWYEDDKVTICYEFLDDIWKNAATATTLSGIAPIDTVMGPFVDVVLHEAGHAIFDMLKIPVFGREEDAADQFSVYIMLRLQKDEARRLIMGTAYQYKSDVVGHKPPVSLQHFANEHGTGAQRFFNVLCLGYGSDPKLFADFVEKGYLPKERAEGCEDEYKQVAFAFDTLIRPHIDRKLARKLYTIWLPPVEARPRSRPRIGVR
jgi:hypothetical protein